MARVARDAGLSRESLYKALSGERSPDFDTILKVTGALGLKLHAKVSDVEQSAQSGVPYDLVHKAARGNRRQTTVSLAGATDDTGKIGTATQAT